MNNLPYFKDASGCRFGEQAEFTHLSDVNKKLGGQLSPVNCIAAADCKHPPDTASDQANPIWSGVQMAATVHNGVMQETVYDVCYCDDECTVYAVTK